MSIKIYFQGLIRLTVERNLDSLKNAIEAIEAARYRTVHLLVCELLVGSWVKTDFNTLIEFLRQIYSRTYEPVGTRVVLTLPELSGCESPALCYAELDVLYECFYSNHMELSEVNQARSSRGLKEVEQVCLTEVQPIEPFTIEWPEPLVAPLFKKTAIGGTFDYLHAAHMLLLTIQSLLTEKELVIGITTDNMIKNKRHPCYIQSFNERSLLVRQFFALLHPGQVLQIVPLKDRVGPTATDPDIQAVILSKEVEAAGPMMNSQRAENGLPPMELYVLDDVGLEDKFSSTQLRSQLLTLVKDQGCWMKGKWFSLCNSLSVNEEAAWDWYSLFIRKYCRSYRGYHNMSHVLDLLQKLEGRTLANRQVVELAIWFHDVIYDTYDTSQNEKLSADLCSRFLTSHNIAGCDAAVTYVLSTQKHIPVTGDTDELEFLDLDMSILGAEPARYAEYSAGIRKEYYFLGQEDFRDRRSSFLRSCLKRTQLFFLPHNQEAWTLQAQTNMRLELEALNVLV